MTALRLPVGTAHVGADPHIGGSRFIGVQIVDYALQHFGYISCGARTNHGGRIDQAIQRCKRLRLGLMAVDQCPLRTAERA